MGGLWWWVRAGSAREITDACAEVEVVTDPGAVRRAEADASLEEVDLAALPADSVLAGLRARRDAQRGRPGFGALVGRERVYLRMPFRDDAAGGPPDPVDYLLELGPDGRWIRQVELAPDGGLRMSADDWPINPPFDLYDPELAGLEIDARTFEDSWRRARPAPGEDG
ncbi:hypothetical protein DEF23_18830 [Marinitenerispora sediminis]|uniref:Uncharacterized protein n=2 Tax=Marinitenerispora sediminis TaxID=1931232 RepID=A0A368T345_9ACTN|nr:hypothetical protein DEF28_23540 [Marinitenerispora sediminis]RCV52525.1 hypothetical protein DEF23_18830 [Marinitenerispora sediminis]RCV56390.1 hypothetical protein DEF24_16720 [Marinitenerispora sediminis]